MHPALSSRSAVDNNAATFARNGSAASTKVRNKPLARQKTWKGHQPTRSKKDCARRRISLHVVSLKK
eukprot:7005491-Pyramimonas_sp.AAC.1